MNFKGYKRNDGQIGIRNKVLIITVDECAYGIAKNIASDSDEVVVIVNHATCMLGGNEETLQNMIETAKNPNVFGCLVLAMGCGSITPDLITKPLIESGKEAYELVCSDEKGTINTIKEGKKIINKLIENSKKVERVEASIKDLIIGVKCGGSDTSSGIASNPSAGLAADKLVEAGATVIAGELFEVLGCEDLIVERCVDDKVKSKLLRLIEEEGKRWSVRGAKVETMSVGNYANGLSTIEEKSLGAIYKMGNKPIQGVLEFNHNGYEKPTKPGMYLSDVTMLCGGAGMHFASVGANLVLWTSGAASFDNQIVPVIRISGNTNIINEDQDIDATKVMTGEETIEDVASKILEKVYSVANGEKTAIEGLSYSFPTLYQKDRRLETLLESGKGIKCNRL